MEVAIQPTRRKRGNNEGSIKKRQDGRWEAQYSVKRQSDGKTVRRSLYGKSRQEVQEKLQEVLVVHRALSDHRRTVALSMVADVLPVSEEKFHLHRL